MALIPTLERRRIMRFVDEHKLKSAFVMRIKEQQRRRRVGQVRPLLARAAVVYCRAQGTALVASLCAVVACDRAVRRAVASNRHAGVN